MKYNTEIGNIKIFQNKPIDIFIKKMIKEAIKINSKIFKTTLKKRIYIYFCSDYSEIYQHAKVFHKWSTASVERNKIIIRTVDWIEKIGKLPKKDIGKIMIHEFNHVYWDQEYGLTKPNWLMEGLASYVGRDFSLSKKELRKLIKDYKICNTKYLHYRFLRRNYKEGHYPRYPLWADFTGFLVKTYSISRILKFMAKFSKNPTEKNYNYLIKKVFGKDLGTLFKNFLDYSKIPKSKRL